MPLLFGQSLEGTVTDPSGAVVPVALIQLRGPDGEKRQATDAKGHYAFPSLPRGKYQIRVIAKGFNASDKQNFTIDRAQMLDVQLSIESEQQVINVEEDANRVSTDPASNAGSLILGERELAALSDDPDELEQQLQAMAGPGAGPSGGQIYIDGFTGGQIPPKNSIREVRINSNPYSPEYDRPGFGRIEIFTKPGTDSFQGQGFMQFNNQYLNSRSPLLATDLPPYKQLFYGATLGGPIKKEKASFNLNVEHRSIDENAVILATTLDDNLNRQTVNQAVVTPQSRTSITPRIDYNLNPSNTLVARYQYTRVGLDNEGIGDFNLNSQAYNKASTENTLQLTETAVINPSLIAETRFQYMRSSTINSNAQSSPEIAVSGAFTSGGATEGDSRNVTNHYELQNNFTWTHGTHSVKWGDRIRASRNEDTALNNFNGTFTFFGGMGPALDANNQPIAGTSVDLTALEIYQSTLLLQRAGYSAAQIRALGRGASLFTLNTGTATTSIDQVDLGLFINDDWRVRPNLTLSYGLRYEAQTNIGDLSDLAPRLGIAWGIDGKGTTAAKTVLRAGFGTFYDRVTDTTILNTLRYNGKTQPSYLITNPDFFPNMPSVSSLTSDLQTQQLQILDGNIKAPRTYQASVGVDRQINKHTRLSINYINSRGVHLLRSRDINAPQNGIYPFGDQQVRFLEESTGFSRSNQIFVAPNLNYGKISLFGFYALSYGKDDNEGQPADPYNLRAEWGPSSIGDVRNRAVVGTNFTLPWKFSLSPFLMASSGTPYTVTTGLDTYGDGITTGRPELLTGVSAKSCNGSELVYASGYGCFDLTPAAGAQTIGRNSARGPANVTLSLRLGKTWAFGSRGESGINDGGPPPGVGGARGSGAPPPGGPGGGGPPGGGPPPGLFGDSGGKRYSLNLSIFATNVLNHANFGVPDGDLSSPYFGQYRTIAGGFGPPSAGTTSSSYNRKVSIQLRFTF